jgi:hypothetical protein
MESRVAVVTINASSLVVPKLVLMVSVLAQLANSFVLARRDHLEAFSNLQGLCIAESNLWRENRAIHVYPVVTCCRF